MLGLIFTELIEYWRIVVRMPSIAFVFLMIFLSFIFEIILYIIDPTLSTTFSLYICLVFSLVLVLGIFFVSDVARYGLGSLLLAKTLITFYSLVILISDGMVGWTELIIFFLAIVRTFAAYFLLISNAFRNEFVLLQKFQPKAIYYGRILTYALLMMIILFSTIDALNETSIS